MKRNQLLLFSFLWAFLLVLGSLFSHPKIGRAETAVAPADALPQSSEFSVTLFPTADSYVASANPNTNYGTAPGLQVSLLGFIPNVESKRALIAYDLSGIPANAVILTATLRLYGDIALAAPDSPEDITIIPYSIDSPWVETAVTWANRPTSSYRNDPGAAFVPGWTEFDLVNMVSGWVAGDYPNYGVWLSTGVQGSATFYSRDMGSVNWPRLEISYRTEGSPLWAMTAADTWVNQANPTTNYNNDATVSVARFSGGSQNHALLKFDLSDLPANIVVSDARLEMFSVLNRGGEGEPEAPLAFSVYPDAVMADWNPATVNWNNKPVTLNVGDPPVTPIYNNWTQWNVTNIVQGWADGTRPNYGIALRPGATDTGAHYFLALPNASAARLIIYYEEICNPPASVTISGVTQGSTGAAYTFTANVAPGNVTPPLTYAWTATGQTPVTGPDNEVTFTWSTAGSKTVNVTVSGCGGSASASHAVAISLPPPTCEFPLTGLALTGPTTGLTGVSYAFDGAAAPANATLPITHTWQATDHASQQLIGGVNSNRNYTWDSPGAKVVSLESANCGASFVRHHTINIQPRPDLTITGAWYDAEQTRLYYIIKNVGGSSVAAGHQTRLFRDGTAVATVPFEEALAPGAMRVGSVPYNWSCAAAAAQMRVCADATNIVPEANEANNCFEESWSCDLIPPTFTSGPTVDQIGETSARIRWQTNEATTGRLYLSGMGLGYGDPVQQTPSGTQHTAMLTGLEADRTYRYQIVARDAGGNEIQTSDGFFRTATQCSDPPVVSQPSIIPLLDLPYDLYQVRASVTDPACMEHLAFFWDGQLFARDYSPDDMGVYEVILSPQAMGLTRDQFFDQAKELRVQAYSLGGAVTANIRTVVQFPTPIQAQIDPPADPLVAFTSGNTMPSGSHIDVTAYTAEFGWRCRWDGSGFPDGVSPVRCGDVRQPVQSVQFRLNGQPKGGYSLPDPIVTYPMNIGGLAVGTHMVQVCADLSNGQTRCASQQLLVQRGEPELTAVRTVSRIGNYFQVDILLSNQGTTRAFVQAVQDTVWRFQPADKDFSDDYSARVLSYDPALRRSIVQLKTPDNSHILIMPGQSYTLRYVMVPILYDQPLEPLGSGELQVTYRTDSAAGPVQRKLFTRNFNLVHDGVGGPLVPLTEAVTAAFAASDYVIVTHPVNLATLPTGHIAEENNFVPQTADVLAKMGYLAYLRNGVVGYLDSPEARNLAHLVDVRRGRHWTSSLHPDFNRTDKGYLLIVGETEVLPAYYRGTSHFVTYPGVPDWVNDSDLPYADTAGQTERPELVVGRIIGNGRQDLWRTLHLTTQVYDGLGSRTFDRSHALLISGSGSGELFHFVPTVINVQETLAGRGWQVTSFHAMVNPGGDDADFNVWKPWAVNQDLLFFRDHGNIDNWGGMLTTSRMSQLNLAQGNSAPIGFAAACLAGNYERSGDYNLAEAFLGYGGAAYIGATEISERSTNTYASKWLFRNWPTHQSIGAALNRTKRAAWDDDGAIYDHGKLWAYEYNLYGCPKYGVTAAATAVTPAIATPTTNLNVQIPDLQITELDELDWSLVEIPGGQMRLLPGGLELPYWEMAVEYPAGFRVADVQLLSAGTPTVLAGLRLPPNVPGIDCTGCEDPPPPDPIDTMGWVPDPAHKFAWRVEDGGDGRSTLWLTVYPFFYRVETEDAVFYQNFTFDVTVIESDVRIVSWQSEDGVVGLGETAVFHLHLDQTTPQDVVVEVGVKPAYSETPVDGFPVRLLEGLEGAASLSYTWDTTGFEPGDYRIEARVRDLQGNLLTAQVTRLTLGRLAGEGTALTASPTIFQPGGDVAIAFTFRNSGDMVLDGTAVIAIQPLDGLESTIQFTHTVASLAPGGTLIFNNLWQTTGVPEGDYQVVAYVKFGGGVSAPRLATLSTQAYLYLPTIIKP